MDFQPSFCPHQGCPSHSNCATVGDCWYRKDGFRSTKVVGAVQKFRCRVCGRGFSQRTFDIDYWTHRSIDYQLVQNLLVGGSGLRQSSRTLGVSLNLIGNRHARLARQALAIHSSVLEKLRLCEDLVFDGFESFAYSQYYPNNINLLVGADSQFVLGMNATVLRRKGRMTELQKEKRKNLEGQWRAPGNGIYRSSRELLNWACHVGFGSRRLPLVIKSDEKKEYARALGSLKPYGGWLGEGLIDHQMTSSKAARTFSNPLFPVNYLDRQLRKDLAEHVRETVRFSRRIEFSLERATIHLFHHNYFKSFRSRCLDKEKTHAEVAGFDRNDIKLWQREYLTTRVFGWREGLESWALDLWRRKTTVPVHPLAPLARHLLTA